MKSADIFALRKQSRAAEALAMARQEFPEHENDVWFLRAYGWSIYDHVKVIVERYETKQLSPTGMVNQLTPYMREFSRMADLLRGDTIFSQMLRLAGKVSRDWPEFLEFAKWAGIDGFSDEDKKSFVNEQGKAIDSLYKRFIRAVCREVASKGSEGQKLEWFEWGKGIMEQALQADPHDQWLNYYRSKLYLAEGESDQAIQYLMPILRRQSKLSWPWALLGEILEVSQFEDALTCYIYATQLAREEQEVAKVRIHLAKHLAHLKRFNEAAYQAHQALQYRESGQFRIPPELQQLLVSDWYRQAISNNTLQSIQPMHSAAKALLQMFSRQNLTFTLGVIDHINQAKELSFVVTSSNSGMVLLHKKFPEIRKIPVGTVIEVGYDDPSGHPLDWRVSEAEEIPNLYKAFSGTLERQRDKAFAFIRSQPDDIFVTPYMAETFAIGQSYEVSCKAIKHTNKQGKVGWRAVKLQRL